MKTLQLSIQLLFLLLITTSSLAQDSLIHKMLSENATLFQFTGNEFTGEGWDNIQKAVNESANVLIGEDHFTNEIPAFSKAIFDIKKFDNFFIEVDPYSTEIIVNAIKNTRNDDSEFIADYKGLFSFYALEPEFDLLKHIVKAGTNVLGADQIVAYADRLLCNDLSSKTENNAAKETYRYIAEQSKTHLEEFFKDPSKPMYFMTSDFSEQLTKLASLDLNDEEAMIVQDMKKSTEIYQPGGHKKRIQLIKHYLMKNYTTWANAQNLYKYGAMHMARGESFLTIYDMGNLVANIAESNYEKSYHIMVIGESGMQGVPFKTFPASPVNTEKGILKPFKPFFEITNPGDDWYVFDLLPLRKAVNKGKVKIDDITLLRAVKGFDAMVIIPEVSAAKF